MAAIGLVQLKYLDQGNSYRRQLAEWYRNNFETSSQVQVVPDAQGCESAHHLLQVLVDNRDELILALNNNGCFPVYTIATTPIMSCTNMPRGLVPMPIM